MESTDEQQCRIWLDTAFFGADCFQKGKQTGSKKKLVCLTCKNGGGKSTTCMSLKENLKNLTGLTTKTYLSIHTLFQ